MNIERAFIRLGMATATFIVNVFTPVGGVNVQDEAVKFNFRVGCDYHDYIGDNNTRVIESHPYLNIDGNNLSEDADYVTSLFNITRGASTNENYPRPRAGHLNMTFHPGLINQDGRSMPLFPRDRLLVTINGTNGENVSGSVELPVC